MKKDKKRFSVTLKEPYIEAISKLVETGIYLNSGDVIRQALRTTFRIHGIDPFKENEV